MFPTDFYAVVLRVPEEYFIFKNLFYLHCFHCTLASTMYICTSVLCDSKWIWGSCMVVVSNKWLSVGLQLGRWPQPRAGAGAEWRDPAWRSPSPSPALPRCSYQSPVTRLCLLVLQTKAIRRFVIMEKAPTRAFSWLKAATFTFKTLLIKTLCSMGQAG